MHDATAAVTLYDDRFQQELLYIHRVRRIDRQLFTQRRPVNEYQLQLG